MDIKIKKQILFILLGIIFISSFYLIWKIYIHKPEIPSPPKEENIFEKNDFVYFQVPTGKIIENIVLNEQAQEKTDDIKERVKELRDMSEKLKDLSQDLKQLTDECACGKSSCEKVECESGCCCQAQECSAINTCSKPNGCFIENPGCDISKACPESNCDLKNIKKKSEEMEKLIDEMKAKRKEVLIAQLSISNDYLNLNKIKTMMSSTTEAIDYETFFNRKDSIQSNNQEEVEIKTFQAWPLSPTIEKKNKILFDPATIYFDYKESKNKGAVDLASCSELSMLISNQSPDSIAKIMDENVKEVIDGLNIKELFPSSSAIDNIMQEAIEKIISPFSKKISNKISDALSVEITNIIIEELKGDSGLKSSLPIRLIEPMSVILSEKLPSELKFIFNLGIEKKVSEILSNTDLFSSRISNLLFEKTKDFAPDDIKIIISKNIGKILPGGIMEAIDNNIINEMFKSETNESLSEIILKEINLTLSTLLPNEANQATHLSLTNGLYFGIKNFLSENIPQTLGFLLSSKEELSISINQELEQTLFDILYKELDTELTVKQAQDFSSLLFSSGIISKGLEENISKNFDLIIETEIEEMIKEISYNISEKISSGIADKIISLKLEEIIEKASKDLEAIISPAISENIEQGIILNSLHGLIALNENGQELKISYPQNYEFILPNVDSSIKEPEMFEAHRQAKIIYDIISEQINVMGNIIKLVQSPEKGCNPDICSPQCVDATCYAKDFYCEGVELKDFLGSCSKYQTSYPDGPLPCKSEYIDFYNQNGQFNACPSIYSGDKLIKEYNLKIKDADKAITKILEKKYDQESSKFKENISRLVRGTELLTSLSDELIQMTNNCKCSEESLCEELSHGCTPKGCSLSGQCSEEDLKNINEKIYDIEYAIQDLYYNSKYK